MNTDHKESYMVVEKTFSKHRREKKYANILTKIKMIVYVGSKEFHNIFRFLVVLYTIGARAREPS